MPLYEFRCSSCGHLFETLVRTMAVPGDLACPRCGNKKVQRLLSSFFSRSVESGAQAKPERCRECPGGGPSCPFSQDD
ncbi:MAG: zinc ribbon domain-containing protein [Armatimonadota bacterium]|nr:zinc ribbon domain-containing protein [Armatimonadota bacterium]